MSGPGIRYPSGPITPAGAHHILRGRIPKVALLSYNGEIVFEMMGGHALHDQTIPERVILKDIRGLVPPWQMIDQKGATQDGTTFIDALYDPTEVGLTVIVKGRNPHYFRKVRNHLLESIDAKETSELSWWTHGMGRWWADLRWFQTLDNPMASPSRSAEQMELRMRCDDAFWRSYDSIDSFQFQYEAITDTFNYVDTGGLGGAWTIEYTGPGAGNLSANGSQAVWVESGTDQRTAIARNDTFTTDTDNQVVSIVLGSFSQDRFFENSYVDLWARMANTGTPGQSGVRLRIAGGYIELAYFIGGVKTVLRQYGLLHPRTWVRPYPGEKLTLVAGYEDDDRMFKVYRNNALLMSVKEPDTGSQLGASFRRTGFGVEAGDAAFQQLNPPRVRKFAAGDNSTVSQTGFLSRVNAGDQPMWDRYTVFGPGTFRFGNGPGSDEMVEFGPLLPNQIMYLRTDPSKRGVDDLTVIPPTQQELTRHQKRLLDYYTFASGGNVSPLQEQILSRHGIAPPQGNPYSLLSGRWSEPIPAKLPGVAAQEYHTRVEIDDGNADSKIIVAGTPLRRNPY